MPGHPCWHWEGEWPEAAYLLSPGANRAPYAFWALGTPLWTRLLGFESAGLLGTFQV